MKKLFILLFSLGMLNTVFAQRNDNKDWRGYKDDNYGQTKRNDVYNNGRNSNNSYSIQDRNRKIAEIKRESKDQIEATKRDRRLSRSERNRQIDAIERQRDYRIDQVNQYYARSNNGRYDDRTASSNRRF